MAMLRVIDFEGTGLELPAAEVIEVGYVDVDRDSLEIGAGADWLCGVAAVPPETRAVHHIWPEDVAGLAPFDAAAFVARTQSEGIVGLVAYNIGYEGMFLGELPAGLPLVCAYKAALRTWPDAPSHSNFGLLYWLMDQGLVEPSRKRMTPSHRAQPDAYATAHILCALYRAGVTGRELVQWTSEPRVLPRCPIGNWRGRTWAEVDWGFLHWILSKHDMDPDIAWNARREIDRREAEQHSPDID